MTRDFNEVDILLVEDNLHDAELTKRALLKNGFNGKLFLVENGVDALDFIFCIGNYADRINSGYPKVILLDLKLPRKSGLEVLEMIKKNEKTYSIPIVVLTSSQEESDITKAYALGVNSFVVKPLDFSEFTRTVGNIGLYWLTINQTNNTSLK